MNITKLLTGKRRNFQSYVEYCYKGLINLDKYRKVGPAIMKDIGKFIIHGGDYTLLRY